MIYFCVVKDAIKKEIDTLASISPSAAQPYFLPQTQKPISNALPLAINSLLIVKSDTFPYYRVSNMDWISFKELLISNIKMHSFFHHKNDGENKWLPKWSNSSSLKFIPSISDTLYKCNMYVFVFHIVFETQKSKKMVGKK